MPSALDELVLSRIVATEAARRPHRLVYVFENGPYLPERVTVEDIARAGNQIAAAFLAAGLRPGDPVAVMLRNHPEFIHTLVGNAKLGLPTIPVDHRTRGEQLAWLLAVIRCAALVTADYVVADPAAAAVIADSGVPTWVLSTAEGRAQQLDYPSGWHYLNRILIPRRPGPDVGEHVHDPGAPWLLLPTAGRTGELELLEVPWARMALLRAVPGFLGYRRDDVPYTGLTLAQGNALALTAIPPLVRTVRHSVISRWFTKSRLWRICADFGATTWSSAGVIASAVYSLPSSDADRSHTVRLVVSTGMPPQIWRAFEERYGVAVTEWYGTMEGAFACNPAGTGPIGSFGRPPAGVGEMDVIDGAGRPVPSRAVGELVFRPTDRHAWMPTGATVTRDDDGWLYAAYREPDEPSLRATDIAPARPRPKPLSA
jgi:crotonobetaine/carnitine-CoA ligase